MIRVGVIGAEGRMGQRIIKRMQNHPKFKLTAALTEEKSFNVGKDAGSELGIDTGVKFSSDLESMLGDCPQVDVMVDFSTPKATIQHLPKLWDASIPIVIGTRGFSIEEEASVQAAAHEIPVLMSRNASIGINMIYNFLNQAARTFGDRIQFEIVEDAESLRDRPSTISTKMVKTILAGQKIELPEIEICEGLEQGAISSHVSYKKVGKAGEDKSHSVRLLFGCEEIRISHKVHDYDIYADGALWSMLWLVNQRPGFYEMSDVMEGYEEEVSKK